MNKKETKQAFHEDLEVGWREWGMLPGLNIPAIKVKNDTGAKTSALHAFNLETFKKGSKKFVRFQVHPLQKNDEIVISCELPVLDERTVKSSNGQKEKRISVMATIGVGKRQWDIELTLTNRDIMSYRMLLGREAMSHLLIKPYESFLQGKMTKQKAVALYK